MKQFVDLEGLKLFLELFKEALANNAPDYPSDLGDNKDIE